MHIILTGATGLVGSAVLDAMIKTSEITQISILSRKPVALAEAAHDDRVKVILNEDFEKYGPEILSQLKGAVGCVWALGISQTQVDAQEYKRITKTMTLAAAQAFQSLPPEKECFKFVFVSGSGATTEPGTFSARFARVKGEAELALADLSNQNPMFRPISVRPAFIDFANHAAIQPYIPRRTFGESAATTLFGPAIRRFIPSFWSPTVPLGRFLTELAMGKHGDELIDSPGIGLVGQLPILENSAFRRLSGLEHQ